MDAFRLGVLAPALLRQHVHGLPEAALGRLVHTVVQNFHDIANRKWLSRLFGTAEGIYTRPKSCPCRGYQC